MDVQRDREPDSPADPDGLTTGDSSETTLFEPPMPPADTVPPDAAQQRRDAIGAMVERSLPPAFGLARRALDPFGLDPQRSDEARGLAMRAIADSARQHIGHGDDDVRRVIRRLAELGMDAMVSHPGSAAVPSAVDLDIRLTGGLTAHEVAPDGRLAYAELQDAVAASRATDRQTAFVVLACGVPPGDAAVLLGRDDEELDAALNRIGKRLSEGHVTPAVAS